MSGQFLVQFDIGYADTISVPKLILKNFKEIGIKPNEWSFYCLISYLQADGQEIPSQPELGAMMGLSERQIKNIIADLKNKDMLTVKRARKGSGPVYDFDPLFRKAIDIEYS
ncbi:hypothetical protein [Paenibacillus illinoisensis]|uniref:hypothetical protein n=1 Tax=Paenibacillus illinoisensis TaxID=59845 RepID=UPI003019B42E